MNRTLINKNVKDNLDNPIFFGEPMGMQRFDKPKYKQIKEFYDTQFSWIWRPEEISLGQDKKDFADLAPNAKRIVTMNLGYQMLLDSAQTRGIGNLLEHCTNAELELALGIWMFEEGVHSKSYTYIVQNVYDDPSIKLDELQTDPEILKRANGVIKYYDDLINMLPETSDYDKKKKLYLTLVSIQIIEAISFYVSFACNYAFDELGIMKGNSKIIQLINRSENLHVGFTNTLIKILTKNENEGFVQVVEDCKELVNEMWSDAAVAEIEWAKYLFAEGDIIGLNAEILEQYMYYLCNLRMKSCGMQRIFPITKNPILWIQKYTNSSAVQNAPQESEEISYLTNSVTAEGIDDLDEFEL